MEDKREVGNQEVVDDQRAVSYGLLYIIRAYNRKEITFEEWLRQSREWAEQMIRQNKRAD